MSYFLNNPELIHYLVSSNVLYRPITIDAFLSIDRKYFVQKEFKKMAYVDTPLAIGHGQTISQPRVTAFMIELLDVHQGFHVLDIGSGSGYTTALLSQLIGPNGHVFGVERVPELVEFANHNIEKYPIKNATIIAAQDTLGIPTQTFDRILVSASASELPLALIDQLNEGGKLVIPIKNSIFLIEKEGSSYKEQEFKGYVFVPLIV